MDTERLEEFILERMREFKVPGISIGIVKDGRLVYARGFGFRDMEAGLPTTPGTIYGIGSITKAFTALSILKLAKENRLNLNDPVEKYIPLRLRPFGEPVLVHHLLTHTSVPRSPHPIDPNHPSSLVGPCPHARGVIVHCPRGWVLDHPLHRIPLGQAVTAKTRLGI